MAIAELIGEEVRVRGTASTSAKGVRVRTAPVQGGSGQLSLRLTVRHHPHTLALASPWPGVRSGAWQSRVDRIGQREG